MFSKTVICLTGFEAGQLALKPVDRLGIQLAVVNQAVTYIEATTVSLLSEVDFASAIMGKTATIHA